MGSFLLANLNRYEVKEWFGLSHRGCSRLKEAASATGLRHRIQKWHDSAWFSFLTEPVGQNKTKSSFGRNGHSFCHHISTTKNKTEVA
jgi:hypothetical protein